jgi:hypothetical protein
MSSTAAIHITAPDLVALQRGLAQAPKYTRERLLDAMTEATLYLEREVKDRFPAVSGLTRNSITSDAFSTSAGVLGVVGSASIAAVAVELGTKPHMPPVAPIVIWVIEKLGLSSTEARGAAFAIARKIARVGTKGQGHFQKAMQDGIGTLSRIFSDAAQDVAAHLVIEASKGRS